MPKRTLGSELSHALKARGVDTIFGIPGVHNVEMYRGIEEAGIRHILTRHEQGAGFMADGYARATGRPGVAYIITGPGLTNIMTPMGQAQSDSVPVLVLSSCLPPDSQIPGQLHQMKDQTGAAATVCDWSVLAEDADAAYAAVDRAFTEFASQRKRAKHLTVPIDILGEPAVAAPEFSPATLAFDPDRDQIEDLADRLAKANKPLFLFGGGAVHASQDARRAARAAGAASFTSYAGRGVIGPDDPLHFGGYLARPDSAAIFAKADLVVAVATEIAQVDLWRDQLGHGGTLVRIDIDDAVLNDSRAADIRIRADAAKAMAMLAECLEPQPARWDAAEVARTRAVFRAQSDAERPGIAPLAEAMQATLPPETMYFSDMTQFAYTAKEVCPMDRPGHWHHPFGFGTLGYALPAAIGGKIGRPELPVVAIAGDYGFQYTIQELGVAAELKLPLPIILWDNGKLKEIEDCMVAHQIAPNAVVAQNPDFGLLAAAYGIAYCRPGSISAFRNDIRAALDADGPTIIHITPVTSSSS